MKSSCEHQSSSQRGTAGLFLIDPLTILVTSCKGCQLFPKRGHAPKKRWTDTTLLLQTEKYRRTDRPVSNRLRKHAALDMGRVHQWVGSTNRPGRVNHGSCRVHPWLGSRRLELNWVEKLSNFSALVRLGPVL